MKCFNTNNVLYLVTPLLQALDVHRKKAKGYHTGLFLKHSRICKKCEQSYTSDKRLKNRLENVIQQVLYYFCGTRYNGMSKIVFLVCFGDKIKTSELSMGTFHTEL